ncbi:MAG: hypothetical protein WC458_03440 [Patescibacteria group bacterium]
MKIKGIEFSVNAGAGALGWWGEGYWYHKIYKRLIPSFKKTAETINFVAKTTTIDPRKGNLPLKEDYTPIELFPQCIKVYPFRGMMLNAVGLSGPGFKKLLDAKKWQEMKRPAWGISFMPISNNVTEMLYETDSFRYWLLKAIDGGGFRSPFWIQLNVSCPNTEQNYQELSGTMRILKTLKSLREELNLVVDLKINLLMPNTAIKKIWEENLCDLITISNTLKYGTVGFGLNWKKLFWWRKDSPLKKFGGGGLSGKPLFDAVCKKIVSLRQENIHVPIKASGGICSKERIRIIKICGADAIEFATVISLRPWRIYGMVKEARKIFS